MPLAKLNSPRLWWSRCCTAADYRIIVAFAQRSLKFWIDCFVAFFISLFLCMFFFFNAPADVSASQLNIKLSVVEMLIGTFNPHPNLLAGILHTSLSPSLFQCLSISTNSSNTRQSHCKTPKPSHGWWQINITELRICGLDKVDL